MPILPVLSQGAVACGAAVVAGVGTLGSLVTLVTAIGVGGYIDILTGGLGLRRQRRENTHGVTDGKEIEYLYQLQQRFDKE